MNRAFPASIGWAVVLAACSSSSNRVEGGSLEPKDSGGLSTDAQRDGAALDDGPAPARDAAAACPARSDAPAEYADFYVSFGSSGDGNVSYDGPVTVEAGDGGGPWLSGSADGAVLREELRGPAQPPLGTTLWASLYQSVTHPNPYANVIGNHVVLLVGEHGPTLAESRYMSVSANWILTVIGVPVTFTLLCTKHSGSTAGTSLPCITDSYYSATIHGDSDLTLEAGTSGHVLVGGIEYIVWLASAYSETIQGFVCIADWAPPSGLDLVARVARYSDVLPRRDAGADSGG